jgi:dinuclear metal center YbgI/SA1388 family protein
MKISDVILHLENQFPLQQQADFDNCGLLVGDKNNELKGVLISLDCTEEVLEEAIDIGANLIISHHPIIFKGLKKITGSSSVEKIIIKAIQSNIALYAIHTNLDHSMKGVNFEIAQRLGVESPQILQPISGVLSKLSVYVPESHADNVKNTLFNSGAGAIGNYSECSYSVEGVGTYKPEEGSNPFKGEIATREIDKEIKIEVLVSNHLLSSVVSAMLEVHPYEEVAYDILGLDNENQYVGSGMIGDLTEPMDELTFLAKLKKVFQCGAIRHTQLNGKLIQKVAFCGGSGSFLLRDSIVQKADIFITGDFKYHEFFDAENKIVIADIGHYESEQFTTELIYRNLTEKFVNFAIHKTTINTNPINYF